LVVTFRLPNVCRLMFRKREVTRVVGVAVAVVVMVVVMVVVAVVVLVDVDEVRLHA